MRPAYIYLNGPANSFSPWFSLDYTQTAFAVGLVFSISSGAVLTATAQLTDDDITQNSHFITATQATTVITVTDTGFTPAQGNVNALGGHGLSVGDWVKLTNTANQPIITGMDGEYTVATVPSATTYTLTLAVSQTATAGPSAQAASARVFSHATIAAVAARTASV